MGHLAERDTSLALMEEVFSLYWSTADKIVALIPTHQLLMREKKEVNCFADVLVVCMKNEMLFNFGCLSPTHMRKSVEAGLAHILS